MYGLTMTDLSFALFAAKDCARDNRRHIETMGDWLEGEALDHCNERITNADAMAERFQAAMTAMAVATRHERVGRNTVTRHNPCGHSEIIYDEPATRHDANDYNEDQPELWPACGTCGANSCDCGTLYVGQ